MRIRLLPLFCILWLVSGCAARASDPTAIALPTTSTTPMPTLHPSATRVPTSLPTGTPIPPTSATATTRPTVAVLPTASEVPIIAATQQERRYVFPVRAQRYSVSSSHHDYPAADIACPIGSEFVAVTSGIVDFVSAENLWPKTGANSDKGGLAVAIIGDDGVRYYGSHLSAIAVGIAPGVRVAAGQLLGLTGESGNAAGVYPQLHFGISHPTTADDWQIRRGELWPQKYLKAWAQGKQIAPKLP